MLTVNDVTQDQRPIPETRAPVKKSHPLFFPNHVSWTFMENINKMKEVIKEALKQLSLVFF